MPRMTKLLRDQLDDIAKARDHKAGRHPRYSKAELAAVAKVTARLQEGLKPPELEWDFSGIVARVFSKSLAQAAKQPSFFQRIVNSAGQPRMPVVTILDDIVKYPDDKLDHVDAFRYSALAFETLRPKGDDVLKISCT